MSTCQTCDGPLTGRQTKFCCRKCKNDNFNSIHQTYEVQQERGLKNKIKLLEMKGSKCQNCGYDKNYASLCFHHARDKKFALDLRQCANRSFTSLIEESNKCVVLCHNCHMEHHYPGMVRPAGFEPAP